MPKRTAGSCRRPLGPAGHEERALVVLDAGDAGLGGDGVGVRYRIALVCAEKDPMMCHRALLVCRHLVPLGFSVSHILSDGEIEEHSVSLKRTAAQMGAPLSDLFCSYEELVDDLYARRGWEIEYVETNAAKELS